MPEEHIDTSQKWLSTYSLMTAKRIFDLLNIHLTDEDITLVLKTSNSLYYQLLQIPLKNVLNGIILEQAKDYQIFVQKIFIDYLIKQSPEDDQRWDCKVKIHAMHWNGNVYALWI